MYSSFNSSTDNPSEAPDKYLLWNLSIFGILCVLCALSNIFAWILRNRFKNQNDNERNFITFIDASIVEYLNLIVVVWGLPLMIKSILTPLPILVGSTFRYLTLLQFSNAACLYVIMSFGRIGIALKVERFLETDQKKLAEKCHGFVFVANLLIALIFFPVYHFSGKIHPYDAEICGCRYGENGDIVQYYAFSLSLFCAICMIVSNTVVVVTLVNEGIEIPCSCSLQQCKSATIGCVLLIFMSGFSFLTCLSFTMAPDHEFGAIVVVTANLICTFILCLYVMKDIDEAVQLVRGVFCSAASVQPVPGGTDVQNEENSDSVESEFGGIFMG